MLNCMHQLLTVIHDLVLAWILVDMTLVGEFGRLSSNFMLTLIAETYLSVFLILTNHLSSTTVIVLFLGMLRYCTY